MSIDPTRRELFKGVGAGIAIAGLMPSSAVRAAADAIPDGDALKLWYRRPATRWVEALPLGNGRLGAMVWGGIEHERLQLNEDTLYAGGPYEADTSGALEALPDVRRLIFAGEYARAEDLANAKMMARPLKQMPYQPLADVVLDFRDIPDISDYRRELDLDAAITRSRFKTWKMEHTREAFISPVDQCVVMRLSADRPGSINLRVSLDSDQQNEMLADDGALLLRGRNATRHGVEGRLKFAVRIRAIPRGGSLRLRGERIEIEGADEVVLLITAATSYRRYDDVGGDPEAITRQQLIAAQQRGFKELRAAHVAEHQRLFHRVSIDLGHTEAARLPTDERVERFADGNDPALAALYHQYGRYLLISSSRPGTQPANLQGIWNDLMDPPWESKYTVNINTEMNYWPSEANALHECVEPLERMMFDLAESGARTAKTMYGAPGWVMHHNTDLWRQTRPIDGAQYGLWSMGGAWLLQQLWDRWDYGRDRAYLAKIYPLFKGAAEFFAATLTSDPHTGERVTNPSMSPENVHPHGASLCAGPAMDSQLLRDLFTQCIQAAGLLGVDAGFAQQLQQLRDQLPPDRVGKAGQLQEWREDWDMQVPEIHHRHVSHLYALHPSSQINVRDTPKLAAAARRSLEIRGDDATGWGLGWRLNLWARLGDGEHALKILRMLLGPQRTYPNLFDAHPPFQIDGNFGGTAGITEMLLQSWGGSIFLLPALPETWKAGSVRGLKVRGAAGIELSWKAGRLTEATLTSMRGGRYNIVLGKQSLDVELGAGQSRRLRVKDGKLVAA
ncbi:MULTISPECIES: glycoside hydrolase family 95 protein [unclassified Lysobacter]|uniref:glycoside hydrolase family 95 protein n=1 Tax=unclassified Lysobacter TaxID=2635362 RepID=UPI001BE8337B|nr:MULTISPECIES: glycoside hydrolase family 95 protein [unclassified Lysobacter]MBT2748663.1 glycoside hydrolase family 95 protein [Lysobacter sp. ISL-42]MBT2751598.1 glycoside hydrolase family 95 protein [Lysobacter sp. ISL-50]MBT2775792.1 glycoside hydrolase family 95 protein [Lysobacter sp. ISL-54]MBT2782243.1 glycoside hydrolase family 95 protein [Lysobacter sp. ISL-52]